MARCPRRSSQSAGGDNPQLALQTPHPQRLGADVQEPSKPLTMTSPEPTAASPVERQPASSKSQIASHGCTASVQATPSISSAQPAAPVPALLTAVSCVSHVHLIVGGNALASARCTRSLEVGAVVKVVAPSDVELHYGLQRRVEDGDARVEVIRRAFQERDLTTLGRDEVDAVVDAVFVTVDAGGKQAASISAMCKRLRISVNVADSPALSTFTLLSTYSDGPLHVGITTSGMGCKLASRLRRTLAQALPSGIGAACARLGGLRRRLWEEDRRAADCGSGEGGGCGNGAVDAEDEEEDGEQRATFNKLVVEGNFDAAKARRGRWLAQICEYWPLQKLCELTDADVDALFDEYASSSSAIPAVAPAVSSTVRGSITLVGAGPGDPALLTKAALDAIAAADLILADKLVPAPVLALAPRRASIFIARKFPGNADAAQEELLERGLAGVRAGMAVVRLKQGDPYLYGRGGEEVSFFESAMPELAGRVAVIPGVTSALSAPLFAGIPVTHRGVADRVMVCTGTGRRGVAPDVPVYHAMQTTVFLMACHRLEGLVGELVAKGWPAELPCAVVERASCSDQRVVRGTLESIVAAVEEVGSRPPGLFVAGWACGVLRGVNGKAWVVEEGL
ncbi:hypothetical protein Dda_0286 [Drechslerella dactyloides]|uniref:Precorrin-2 dehydrogenase n=1 Tax=Drechslerella dactyloides TaxID=74499 RepID=A0AAD6NMJ6_DREDA|nr:hypothetical protein Dda_0286 [Drechslerella dactyloides]